MKQKTRFALVAASLVLCGFPGILSAVSGFLIAGLGLLADKAQLKLDTNLDQSSVLWAGLGGVCLGVILVAIPLLVWYLTRRRKPV
jgi:hypothetical protein